jgi:hypothetical protein
MTFPMYRKRNLSNDDVIDMTYYRITAVVNVDYLGDTPEISKYTALEVRFITNKGSKYNYAKWTIEEADVLPFNIEYHFNNFVKGVEESTEGEFIQSLNDATLWLGKLE